MRRGTRPLALAIATIGLLLLTSGPLRAQGGFTPSNRLDSLATDLGLTDVQKKEAKTLLDATYKDAAPVRQRLATTRAAVVLAVTASKPPAELQAAASAYAADVAAMTEIEMTALARVLKMLTDEQNAAVKTNGIRGPFFLVRGMFLDDKKWNTTPEDAGY